MFKLFEELLLRLQKDVNLDEIVPSHQFGQNHEYESPVPSHRSKRSIVQQTHRMINTLDTGLEIKRLCTDAFLDIDQAFNRE